MSNEKTQIEETNTILDNEGNAIPVNDVTEQTQELTAMDKVKSIAKKHKTKLIIGGVIAGVVAATLILGKGKSLSDEVNESDIYGSDDVIDADFEVQLEDDSTEEDEA